MGETLKELVISSGISLVEESLDCLGALSLMTYTSSILMFYGVFKTILINVYGDEYVEE